MKHLHKKSLLLLSLVVLFCSCATTREVIDMSSPYLSCKLDIRVSTDAGIKRLPGVVQLVKGEYLKVSLRAPILRSELGLFEYRPEQLILVDRKNRIYTAKFSNEIRVEYDNVVSFETIESLLLEGAEKRGKRKLSGLSLGWDIFGVETIKFSAFSSSPFRVREFSPSSRYEEVEFGLFIRALQGQLSDL